MLDLVKELREDAAFAEGGEFPEDACRWAITMRQAADEIERLRAEHDKLREFIMSGKQRAEEREACAKIAETVTVEMCDAIDGINMYGVAPPNGITVNGKPVQTDESMLKFQMISSQAAQLTAAQIIASRIRDR